MAAQTLRRVEAVLGQRSAQQQRIFRRAVEEHVPHADLAREEGLSLQRVRQILWEVRVALRAAIEEAP
jgi:DNA-directed RNA polymerase specialized sigma24 family protein